MAQGLVKGGMPDTMEFFTLFHLALKQGGVWELLYTMLTVLVEMFGMYLTIHKLAMFLDRNK